MPKAAFRVLSKRTSVNLVKSCAFYSLKHVSCLSGSNVAASQGYVYAPDCPTSWRSSATDERIQGSNLCLLIVTNL